VCGVLREETYTSPRLLALRAGLETTAGEAQQVVGKLQRLIELHDWQHNILFAPIAALLLWKLHCAFAVEAWRARHGGEVETWLRHVGEFEALSALATYAYEHPADPFPELAETDGPPVYEAEALAHPLIPAATAVANDVALGASPQVLIVSGSNMSGKTTLLRSIGVSAVLALMGAPVRAGRLRLSPVAIGATLRIEDSLQAGRSRFYAEVIRLGQIVATARIRPTLFLFDELFHGTNSHDRTEGARGLLRSLVHLNAIGLVTTHDLALAEIGEQLAPTAGNVHFDDTLVDDEMRFDYCLKAGPVTRSNAIAIMRAVGLDLPNDD
jgi:DNA mismatch repair ATPase MutS